MNKFAIVLSSALFLAACGDKAATPATAPQPTSAPAAASAASASDVAAPVKVSVPEGKGEISKSRSSAFKSFMPTFSSMRKMANGDQAFVADDFKAKAELFTKEAREPFEYFQIDPQGNGDALPAIWEKPAEFKDEKDKFLAAVDKLNEVAQTGKLEDIKAAFGNVGASCKSCHDAFRRPD